MKEAEAKKYELSQEAEAKRIQAEAAKYAMEQEAAGIDKKADAMQKYGEAAIIEMLCNMFTFS